MCGEESEGAEGGGVDGVDWYSVPDTTLMNLLVYFLLAGSF